jgi:hypothetical protein
MALAIMSSITSLYRDISSGNINQINVIYAGADVPNGLLLTTLDIDISTVTTLANFATTLAAGIRAGAIANGFTVPANSVMLPSFSNF